MGLLKNLYISFLVIAFVGGLILFIDEIHMVFPFLIDLGIKGGFLGDWSAYHMEGFHHWQFGVVLMIISVVGGFVLIKSKKNPKGKRGPPPRHRTTESKIKFPKRK